MRYSGSPILYFTSSVTKGSLVVGFRSGQQYHHMRSVAGAGAVRRHLSTCVGLAARNPAGFRNAELRTRPRSGRTGTRRRVHGGVRPPAVIPDRLYSGFNRKPQTCRSMWSLIGPMNPSATEPPSDQSSGLGKSGIGSRRLFPNGHRGEGVSPGWLREPMFPSAQSPGNSVCPVSPIQQ